MDDDLFTTVFIFSSFVKIVENTVSSVIKSLYIHSDSLEAIPLVFELPEFTSFLSLDNRCKFPRVFCQVV